MAITFDAATSGDGGTNTTSVTLSTLTIGGSANFLLVSVSCQRVGDTIPTSVTWNGVSMTKASDSTPAVGDYTLSHWYLANPDTGNHDIVASFGSNVARWGVGAVSLIGVDTSSPIGASDRATDTSTTPSLSLTTTTANSWVLNSVTQNNTNTMTATGTNQTERWEEDVLTNHIHAGSTQTTTTAGSYTSSWSFSSSTLWIALSTEIKEQTGGAGLSTRKTLLGVGI